MLEVIVVGVVALIILGCIALAGSEVGDEVEVYRGEDNHLRVRTHVSLDVPVPEAEVVPELEGDRDVAMFWGTHPSVRRSR